ncbi:MAG: ribosomal protein S18-alanine N-acetyltransferase [Lachnospiraceae bacterium]|nr:ribosomal protein S18-alanine N-acetyltransferase [Lachnospiraceae bacterium]
MKPLRIVPMTPEHVPQVAALEQATFSEPWSEQSLLQAALDERYRYLVCLEDERLVGYAGLLLASDEGQVTNVAVRPQRRGQGVGTRLMEALKEEAKKRGAKRLFLEVRVGNAAARHVYEKSGFVAAGIRRGFYRKPPEDAVVMLYETDGQTDSLL